MSLGDMIKDLFKNLAAQPSGVGGSISIPLTTTFAAAIPQPPVGVLESRDLAHCTPYLQQRYQLLCAEFQARTGRQLFPTRTWSTSQAQFEHFKKGRHQDATGEWVPNDPVTRAGIVTNLDGIHQKGRHNVWPAEAVDSAVDIDPGPGKHVSWDPSAYALLGELCDKHGLVWGGRFHGYGPNGDYPHIEQPAGAV